MADLTIPDKAIGLGFRCANIALVLGRKPSQDFLAKFLTDFFHDIGEDCVGALPSQSMFEREIRGPEEQFIRNVEGAFPTTVLKYLTKWYDGITLWTDGHAKLRAF